MRPRKLRKCGFQPKWKCTQNEMVPDCETCMRVREKSVQIVAQEMANEEYGRRTREAGSK